MQLSTVEIPRAGARESAADYMRAAKTATSPREAREFEEIARAYRIAARDEVALIALTPTIAAGGTTIRTHVATRWSDAQREVVETRQHWLVTNLAVCRPAAAFVYTSGVRLDGSIEFVDSLDRHTNYRRGVVDLQCGFELPDGFHQGRAGIASAWNPVVLRGMVPIVPPKHRPAGGFGERRLILWDCDSWEFAEPPRPPGDPALLRHVGGDIYAVEATWDLTPLEQLVLSGRRAEA